MSYDRSEAEGVSARVYAGCCHRHHQIGLPLSVSAGQARTGCDCCAAMARAYGIPNVFKLNPIVVTQGEAFSGSYERGQVEGLLWNRDLVWQTCVT